MCTLTESTLKFMKNFSFEYKYKENEYSKEYVVYVEDVFSIWISIECCNDFQYPRNAHYGEQF